MPLPFLDSNTAVFKAMLEDSPTPTALIAPAGAIRYANVAFAELHYKPIQELIGTSIFDVVCHEHHLRLSSELAKICNSDCNSTGIEISTIHAERMYRKIRYRLTRPRPTKDEQPLDDGVIVYAQGLAELHHAPLPDLSLFAAQALFEKSPIPMWVFDLESLRFLEVNRACVKQYGYSREEMLELTTLDVRPSGEVPKLISALMDINSTPYPATRWIHRRRDGSTFLAEVFATPIYYGNRDARLVMCFDVTERVDSERALLERNRMLESLGDNLPGGAVYQILQESDDHFRFTFFSAGFERLFGLNPKAIIADPQVLLKAIHPDDWPGYSEKQERSMRLRSPFEHEFRISTTSGEIKWVHCSSAPRSLSDGQLMWDGVVTEITERKRTEEVLLRQQELLQSVGDNLPGGVIYQYVSQADGLGNYTYLSAGVEAISELSREDILSGKVRLRDLMNPEDRDRITDLVGNNLPAPTMTDTEVNVKLPSGKERIWHIRSAIHQHDDRSIVWDGVILDVTDRRKLETQVQQAQKYQSVSVLAGGIAHDFNNLLTGVLGYAELAVNETTPEMPMREYLSEIGVSARRAADLCRQMLAYAGKGRLVRGATDLSGLVREMSRLLRTAISRKTVLQLNLSDGLPPVEGDATQLRQVVMNLITNASESLEERPGVIIIRTGLMEADHSFFRSTVLQEDLPPGNYAFLEVEDTGCGMSPETQSRIFEPFFTTKFSGRGLGLAALLGIVRSHNGAVRVISELGRGTSIRIVVPVLQKGNVAESSTPGPLLPPTKTGPVLVIDDEESVRGIAKTILDKEGFPVTLAEDGQAGLDAFRQADGRFLLVLTDLTMPNLSGLETFEGMRKINPQIRVLLMSGYGESEVKSRYGDYGFTGFLQKPFSPLELRHAVDRAVRD